MLGERRVLCVGGPRAKTLSNLRHKEGCGSPCLILTYAAAERRNERHYLFMQPLRVRSQAGAGVALSRLLPPYSIPEEFLNYGLEVLRFREWNQNRIFIIF